MQINKDFQGIFIPVLRSPACHQKYEKALMNLYASMEFEDFILQFMLGLERAFRYTITSPNSEVDRFLNFMSMFVVNVVTKRDHHNREHAYSQVIESHPLLERIISEVLKYSTIANVEARYHSCQFITITLNHIGDDIQLDDKICDKIQSAMLLRAEDPKPQIRRQAILALVRLQDPSSECAVVKAFLDKLIDPNPTVRREAVLNIALNPTTLLKVIERQKDTDHKVRSAAYYKCSQFGPKFIRIVDRLEVLTNGFSEQHPAVKEMFFDTMLPKWLNFYDGNILEFLTAIKLDGDEADIKKKTILTKKLLNVFFKKNPIKDIIGALNLDRDKLIPIEKINSEMALYWLCLFTYIQNTPAVESYLDEIFPQLTQFCSYIGSFMKIKSYKRMNSWEKLEYDQIVNTLFNMINQFDFSDEVGRTNLEKLVKQTLLTYKLEHRNLLQIMLVMHKLLGNTEKVCEEICDIITQLREREVEKENKASAEKQAEEDYKMALLKVELVTLEDKQECAINAQDWTLATDLQAKIKEVKQTLEKANSVLKADVNEVCSKEPSNDPEVISICLDLLIAVLSLLPLTTLHSSLRIMKIELVDQFLTSREDEIFWRIFKCLTLYSLLDRNIAAEQLRFLVTPILLYRMTAVYSKPVLLTAVGGISDILRIYGTDLFPKGEASDTANTSKRKNGRKLYHMGNHIEVDEMVAFSLEQILESMIDMLEDDVEETREMAGKALSFLIADKIITSPSLLSRLLLKWLNPITEKQDFSITQKFGEAFFHLSQKCKNSENPLQEAIIPTLESIANAPKKSPLSEVNQDKVVQTFNSLITLDKSNNHQEDAMKFSLAICYKIASAPNEKYVHLLTKMLLAIDIPTTNSPTLNEIKGQVDKILKNVTEKHIMRNMIKYMAKLNGVADTDPSEICVSETTSVTDSCNFESIEDQQGTEMEDNLEPNSDRERKSDTSKDCSEKKLLEKASSSKDSRESDKRKQSVTKSCEELRRVKRFKQAAPSEFTKESTNARLKKLDQKIKSASSNETNKIKIERPKRKLSQIKDQNSESNKSITKSSKRTTSLTKMNEVSKSPSKQRRLGCRIDLSNIIRQTRSNLRRSSSSLLFMKPRSPLRRQRENNKSVKLTVNKPTDSKQDETRINGNLMLLSKIGNSESREKQTLSLKPQVNSNNVLDKENSNKKVVHSKNSNNNNNNVVNQESADQKKTEVTNNKIKILSNVTIVSDVKERQQQQEREKQLEKHKQVEISKTVIKDLSVRRMSNRISPKENNFKSANTNDNVGIASSRSRRQFWLNGDLSLPTRNGNAFLNKHSSDNSKLVKTPLKLSTLVDNNGKRREQENVQKKNVQGIPPKLFYQRPETTTLPISSVRGKSLNGIINHHKTQEDIQSHCTKHHLQTRHLRHKPIERPREHPQQSSRDLNKRIEPKYIGTNKNLRNRKEPEHLPLTLQRNASATKVLPETNTSATIFTKQTNRAVYNNSWVIDETSSRNYRNSPRLCKNPYKLSKKSISIKKDTVTRRKHLHKSSESDTVNKIRKSERISNLKINRQSSHEIKIGNKVKQKLSSLLEDSCMLPQILKGRRRALLKCTN